MKKTLNILTCVFTVCAIISVAYICPLAAQYIFTSDYPIHNQNSAAVYFSQLDANFPRNEEGTCAYVAIAMLLSYYDTFWYDGFISEQYDEKGSFSFDEDNQVITMGTSPGVEKEPEYSSLTSTYDELVDLYNDRYFQAMLIEQQALTYIVGQDDPGDTSHKYGLSFFESYALLMYHLFTMGEFDDTDIAVHKMAVEDGDSVTAIRSQMVDNIEAGIPTIYFGLPSSGNVGHVMVAYDYDSTNDELYYHTGWDEERIISDSDNDYNNISGIIWITLEDEFEHICSNSYNDTISNQTVCMCKFAFHPQHTHTLTGDYINYDSSSHIRKCVYCNGSDTESHTLLYSKTTDVIHQISCACGYETTGVHIVKKGGNTCVLCKAIVENGYVALTIKPNLELSYINKSNNDVTHLSDKGIIVLSESDYQLFINKRITLEDIYRKAGMLYE